MTAANHMLTGAVIAVGLQRPLLVFPAAFISHFVLDILPHFGVHHKNNAERDAHPLFKSVLIIDVVLVMIMLLVVPLVFHQAVNWWIVFAGMLIAWLPDAVWLRHFWHDRKGVMRTEPVWLTRFHQKIQWFEKPHGLILEVVWLGAMGLWLRALII